MRPCSYLYIIYVYLVKNSPDRNSYKHYRGTCNIALKTFPHIVNGHSNELGLAIGTGLIKLPTRKCCTLHLDLTNSHQCV